MKMSLLYYVFAMILFGIISYYIAWKIKNSQKLWASTESKRSLLTLAWFLICCASMYLFVYFYTMLVPDKFGSLFFTYTPNHKSVLFRSFLLAIAFHSGLSNDEKPEEKQKNARDHSQEIASGVASLIENMVTTNPAMFYKEGHPCIFLKSDMSVGFGSKKFIVEKMSPMSIVDLLDLESFQEFQLILKDPSLAVLGLDIEIDRLAISITQKLVLSAS
jgi:hypothetical protein